MSALALCRGTLWCLSTLLVSQVGSGPSRRPSWLSGGYGSPAVDPVSWRSFPPADNMLAGSTSTIKASPFAAERFGRPGVLQETLSRTSPLHPEPAVAFITNLLKSYGRQRRCCHTDGQTCTELAAELPGHNPNMVTLVPLRAAVSSGASAEIQPDEPMEGLAGDAMRPETPSRTELGAPFTAGQDGSMPARSGVAPAIPCARCR